MDSVKHYSIGEFGKLLNISVKTLQRWDREGILKAKRTLTNRRYYTYEQYLTYIGKHKDKKTVIYARVSSNEDKLLNQVKDLKDYAIARGIIVDEVIKEIASGSDYNRKEWNRLMDEVIEGRIKIIIIDHKDCFVSFGYEWFHRLLSKFSTRIIEK